MRLSDQIKNWEFKNITSDWANPPGEFFSRVIVLPKTDEAKEFMKTFLGRFSDEVKPLTNPGWGFEGEIKLDMNNQKIRLDGWFKNATDAEYGSHVEKKFDEFEKMTVVDSQLSVLTELQLMIDLSQNVHGLLKDMECLLKSEEPQQDKKHKQGMK